MSRTSSTSVGLIRPVGVAPGTGALIAAWLAAGIVARLTGAVSVTVVLAALVVGALGSLVSGLWRLSGMSAIQVHTGHHTTAGETMSINADIGSRGDAVHVAIADRSTEVASGWTRGHFEGDAVFSRRGIVEHIDVTIRSAGGPGLVWWQRRHRVPIERLVIAPVPSGAGADVEVSGNAGDTPADDGSAGGGGEHELDGIRPWREGDSERSVHWPSSMRTGTLVVHDHHTSSPQRWVVRSNPRANDLDDEASRCRWALDEARRCGARAWAAIGGGVPVAIADAAAAATWSTECVPAVAVEQGRTCKRPAEPDSALTPRARWLVGAATCVATTMLADALDASIGTIALVLVGAAGAAAVTAWMLRTERTMPAYVHNLMVVPALLGLLLIALVPGGSVDLLAMLRGPLPQVLMLLVVLYGFECLDRRAARANLAISVVVATYASGLRVDGRVGLWLCAWLICLGAAVSAVAAPKHVVRRAAATRSGRRLFTGVATAALGVAATVGLLSVVSVPAGPAALTLPAFIDSGRPAQPGGLVGADGTTSQRGDRTTSQRDDVGDGTRDGGSSNGGYTGFAESLDTSVRGGLSDDVVMRVRAAEPDFWRGQTFSEYDGRFWYADTDRGFSADGPSINVAPADGDVWRPIGVESTRFVQSYFIEVDMPNLVLAAYRPSQIIFDGTLWTRPDGSLRSDVTLTEGSVYTVVSRRAEVTEATLRRQGDVSSLPVDEQPQLARYLSLPDTVTDRTRELAEQLSPPGASTYDTVRAMEGWLDQNVQYDLNAPVPADGADAVDDFLFESQLGFCEQIASALTVMLRTQGVPARLVAGYVAGERDRISGVWKVRASDAHAWVEVWFPETGWQAFDPTADVPLAGEADVPSVGDELVEGFTTAVNDHASLLMLAGSIGVLLTAMFRTGRWLVRRRRRGRWGLLQDRWLRAAEQRGLGTDVSNPELARRWAEAEPPMSDAARRLAELLDRTVFDPGWDDTDAEYREATALRDRLKV